MNETKIQLSPAEMELVCNAELILTKNRILQKAKTLLETLAADMMAAQQHNYPNHSLFSIPPKVSKGENYLGLPYLILDYPRIFAAQGIFAIRSMFWWGHFFSSTLQVSGLYKTQVQPALTYAFDTLPARHYYVGILEDPWQHHFEADNYRPIAGFTKEAFEQHCQRLPHIKIAARWPLEQWPLAATHLFTSWTNLVRICLG